MYSTCINCHAPLGANEMLERFPVGRRLAFDASRGRLWAICRVCRQWNLAPLDERWEAIEASERLFRDARLRQSSENVGLARLSDGSELIRIGEARRPEFAAWRYGARFTKRWLINAPGAVAAATFGSMVKFGGIRLLFSFGAIPAILVGGGFAAGVLISRMRVASRLTLAAGERVPLTNSHIIRMRIIADDDEPNGWYLRLKRPPASRTHGWSAEVDPETVVRGAEAVRIAAQLLPRLNRTGGRKSTVADAVGVLERFPSQDAVFRLAGRFDTTASSGRFGRYAEEIARQERDPKQAPALFSAPAPIRLALEMAAHEERERRALEGELADLEREWKEAEEIAAIADSLTLPRAILSGLERLRLR